MIGAELRFRHRRLDRVPSYDGIGRGGSTSEALEASGDRGIRWARSRPIGRRPRLLSSSSPLDRDPGCECRKEARPEDADRSNRPSFCGVLGLSRCLKLRLELLSVDSMRQRQAVGQVGSTILTFDLPVLIDRLFSQLALL